MFPMHLIEKQPSSARAKMFLAGGTGQASNAARVATPNGALPAA